MLPGNMTNYNIFYSIDEILPSVSESGLTLVDYVSWQAIYILNLVLNNVMTVIFVKKRHKFNKLMLKMSLLDKVSENRLKMTAKRSRNFTIWSFVFR